MGSSLNLDIIGESTKTTLNPHATRTTAGTDVGHSSIGTWARISGTWIAPPEDGTAYWFMFNEGPSNDTWWLADVQMLRLSSAMVNVVRTTATDIAVTSAGTRYELGRDYTVANASLPNVAGEVDLIRRYNQTAGRYTIHRLPQGRLRPGQEVNVSYDFLGGMVGYLGDGSHENSFNEPLFYSTMDSVRARALSVSCAYS